ncbi:MAG TPA: hypothetical protein VEA41_13605 [Salinarimonas sp.]|nr:hypothetical protein [Salinarimonas sp.]
MRVFVLARLDATPLAATALAQAAAYPDAQPPAFTMPTPTTAMQAIAAVIAAQGSRSLANGIDAEECLIRRDIAALKELRRAARFGRPH